MGIALSTAEATQMMWGGGDVENWLFSRLKWFEPTRKIEFKLGSKNTFGSGKSGGQSEYQKLQDRTNWLYDQYASISALKREGDASLNMIFPLASAIHGVSSDAYVQALQWNLICQITGIVIPPPKSDIPF